MVDGDIRAESTAGILARRISKAIIDGELAPGSRLREQALAEAYDVSRTPVREALIHLSASGLVELVPNRGATVLALRVEDVAEVYHLRAVLESEAASLAAKVVTSDVVALLHKSCDRLRDLHHAPPAEQLAADTEFHYRIAEVSGSPRLAGLIRQVSAIPEAYRSSIAYTSDDMCHAEIDHRAITGQLAQHRPAGAASLMRRHVHWAGALAVERLSARLRRP